MVSLLPQFCLLFLYVSTSLAATLSELLATTPDLSTLNTLLTNAAEHPEAAGVLDSFTGTFLAPSNDAIDAYISTVDANTPPEVFAALISYHFIPQSLNAAALSVANGVIAETMLKDPAYANLGGGANVVFASAYGSTGADAAAGPLKIYSGVGTAAGVAQPDLAFDGGGFVHVIDRVLNLPLSGAKTAEGAGLKIALDFIEKSGLADQLSTSPKVTVFAPTDDAFTAAGVDSTQLTPQEISDALKYHSLIGEVEYSTVLEDGKEYPTLLGVPVTVHKKDGQLLINDVPVTQGNIIFQNGVAHVIGGLLTPPGAAH